MKIKRFGVAAIALAAAGALTLSGCTSGGASPSAGAGDSSAVITTNGTEPQNPLVPTNTNEVGGGKILDAIFAGLVYYDAEGAPHNDMAESIETDDAQNYTIKLKADQKFTERRARHRRTPSSTPGTTARSSRTSSSRATSSSRSRASATTRTRSSRASRSSTT